MTIALLSLAGIPPAAGFIGKLALFRAAVDASGSHDATFMRNLAEAGVQVSGNTQIGRRNRRELAEIFEAIATAGAHSWQVQLTVAAGRAATSRPWIQAAQFGIELTKDADVVVQGLLAEADDPFGSRTLALGRAVANRRV